MVGERPGSNRSSQADLACALSDEPALRRQEHLASTVFDELEDIEERQTGYAFTFPGKTELIEAVLAFIATERRAVRFSDSNLRSLRTVGDVHLGCPAQRGQRTSSNMGYPRVGNSVGVDLVERRVIR